LTVHGKELLRVPTGQWFNLAITTALGPEANGTWTLAVTLPGVTEQKRFAGLPSSKDFRSLDWIGFISDATQAAVFYLDDLSVGPVR
jgi:hypothetical protein